jgi:hypothetical protein
MGGRRLRCALLVAGIAGAAAVLAPAAAYVPDHGKRLVTARTVQGMACVRSGQASATQPSDP